MFVMLYKPDSSNAPIGDDQVLNKCEVHNSDGRKRLDSCRQGSNDLSSCRVTMGMQHSSLAVRAFPGKCYTAVAMGWDGVLHPCWTDFRGKPGVTSPNQDAYTAAVFGDQN